MRISYRLGAVTAGVATLAMSASVLVGGAAVAADDGPVEAGIAIQKIDGLPDDFINGVDVSSILSEEESGVVFRDFDGNIADPFDVLADAGINYVRVRVWNDPYNSVTGLGYGAGNTDADRATEIGVRATEAGMKVLVDFHYSDFWADPGKQKAPKAWASYTLGQKVDATYAFTEATLDQMHDAGVDVGMVQVGNETNNGVAGVTGLSNMAQIFSAGSDAVRHVYPEALVAVHFTDPQTGGLYASVASALDTAGVDYDIFASSYYPYWHGSLANLTSVLSEVATTYGKKVMVAETSYPYTYADGDGSGNSVTSGATQYPVSVQGQGTAIRDVMAAVHDVGSAGLGVFYWEPAWIPVPGNTLAERRALWTQYGSGWATTGASEYDPAAPTTNPGGSGWDNQALFDYNGYPFESLLAFKYARTGATAPLEVVSVENPTVTVTEGDALTLPSTVKVTYNDSSTENMAVAWDDVLSWITSPGTYTVHGVTVGGHATTATLVVKAENYLVNGDFETGEMSPWWTFATDWPSTGWIYSSPGNNAHGDYAVNFYDADAYDFTLGQNVDLQPGTYTLRGSSHGEDIAPQLFVTTSDGTQTATFSLNGWQNWKTQSITFTIADAQAVTVGAKGADDATSWLWFDDFELVNAAAPGADTAALQALVDQASGLTRSVYSVASVAVLDSALEVANIVLAASVATEQQVTDASALMTDALAGLVVVGDVPDPTVNAVSVSAVEGDPITLPSEVTVTLFDGRTEQHPVTWDDVLAWIDGPGTYTVHGVVDTGLAAVATVTVTVRNWVVNGSFEDANTDMWVIEGAGASIENSADAADGSRSVKFWLDSDYTFTVKQQVTGLPEGSYVLSATTQGGASPDSDSRDLVGTANGVGESAQMALGGWQEFDTATTAPFAVGADGTATVGVNFTLTAEAWGTIDDFRLVRAADAVDTSALEDAVAAAQGLNLSLYTPLTAKAVSDALAAAAIVLAADRPTQATIDAATALLQTAVAGLDLIDVPFTKAPVPTISGTAKVGSTLTAKPGTWSPAPDSFTYQWLRDGVAIAGASKVTYKLLAADGPHKISVRVTGSRADYITTAKTSAAVTVPGVFTKAPKPVISGKAVIGAKLTAKVGTWSPKPSAFTYQWYVNGKAVSKATKSTYTVKRADLGKKVTVKVTAKRTGYTTVATTSAAVKIVKKFASTGYASITGTPKVGKVLTAHRGIWKPAPSGYTFQWYRNGQVILGANKVTYKLTSTDKGKKITVKVTVKKSGYAPTSHTSSTRTVK